MINLHNMDFTNLTSNFGGYIGDLAYRGKGLWNFMVREIQRWAFLDFGFRRLYTEVVKDNFRAMSSYIKAGFTVEGIFREHIIRDSKPLDIYWIGMDKSQWRP